MTTSQSDGDSAQQTGNRSKPDEDYDGLESAVPKGEHDPCGCPLVQGLPEHKPDWGEFFPSGVWVSHQEGCPQVRAWNESEAAWKASQSGRVSGGQS